MRLQHFNRNNVIDTDYLQFTLEQSDFVNYVFSSRSVAHEHFNYERIIGGVMNWLNNLSQSNRMIDISHDWMICLMVSQLGEVPTGMGRKRKHDGKEVECQFPVDLMVNDNNDDDVMFPNSMPFGTSPEFNPSSIINVQNEEFKDDEEYRLFGTPSSTHSDDDNDDGRIEEDDNRRGAEEESNTAESEDDDEMDDDTGTLFTPLLNNETLNFFVDNEVSTVNSTFMVDYFNDECFGNDSELHKGYLLITMYVYYFRSIQYNNFHRTMKNKFWLGKSVKKKLIEIKQRLGEKFAKYDDGRDHWTEVEFMRKCLLEFFPTNFEGRSNTKQKILKFMRENSNSDSLNFFQFTFYTTYIGKTKMNLLKRYFRVVMMAYFRVTTHTYWC